MTKVHLGATIDKELMHRILDIKEEISNNESILYAKVTISDIVNIGLWIFITIIGDRELWGKIIKSCDEKDISHLRKKIHELIKDGIYYKEFWG